jgi:hypothetical protein
MPSQTEDIVANALRAQSIVTISIDDVLLRSATGLSVTLDIGPTAAHAEIGIMTGGQTYTHRTAILAQGTIGSGAAIAWTGQLKGTAEQYLYLSVWANFADTFRLTLISESK